MADSNFDPIQQQGASASVGASGGVATDAGGGGGMSVPSSQPAPFTQPPPGSGSSSFAPEVGQAQQPGPGTSASAASAGLRDALAGYGVDASAFQSDAQALQYLVQLSRQARELQPLAAAGQQYMRHADQFQAWLQERQRAEQQQQQQQRQSWWKAPEYDPAWLNKLYRDPQTGEFRVMPGADPNILNKYMAAVEHQRNFLEKFAMDPIAAIQPGVEELARSIAEQAIQQHLGGYREQQTANEYVRSNSSWLYAADPRTGQPAYDRSGRPVLSELGRRYAAYVQDAEGRLGVMDTATQHQYAVSMVERDQLAMRDAAVRQWLANYEQQQQQQQQPRVDPAQAAKQQFVDAARTRAARPSPQRGQAAMPQQEASMGGGGSPSARVLQETLMKNLQAAGFRPGEELDLGR